MNEILIRVDANAGIGLGHVYRCLELARQFSIKSIQARFVLKYYDSSIISLVSKNNFSYHLLKEECVTPSDEAQELKAIGEELNVKTIILDIEHTFYCENFKYYSDLLNEINEQFFSVVIGSKDALKLNSDLTIVPYFAADNFSSGVQDKNLLGPKYFVLREEFTDTSLTYSVKKDVNNILITMGGSNPLSSIELAIKSIIESDFEGNVTVILGSKAEIEFQLLMDLINSSDLTFNFVCNCKEFAEELIQNDLIFTNSGLTKYEALALGIPTIAFSISEIHEVLMNEFSKKTKAIVHLGFVNNLTPEIIAQSINMVNDDFSKRKSMSINGRKILDGKGSLRIVNEIIQKLN